MEPWYKKYLLAFLAGLGLVLAGLAMAFSGGKRGNKVGKLESKLRTIDDEQTLDQLKQHKRINEELEAVVKRTEEENKKIHQELKQSPDYDSSKSDSENLKVLRSKTW